MMLPIAVAVTCALVVERITFAWVSLLFYLFHQGPDRKSVWFVSSLMQLVFGCAGAVVTSLLRLVSFSVRSVLWCVLILAIWGLLYACALHWAEALVAFQAAYNSSVGGALRLAIVIPMRLLQLVWDGLVPLYNLFVYCTTTVPTRVLLESVLLGMDNFIDAAKNLVLFISTTTGSLYNYVQIIVKPPDSFDPNLRLLDLVTPLAHLRLAA